MPISRKRGVCTSCGVLAENPMFSTQLRYTSKEVQVENLCLDCAQMLLVELTDLFSDSPWGELRVGLLRGTK